MSETSYDFGTKLQDKPLSHEFAFKNSGTAPLNLSVKKTGCGCTVPALSSQTIAPGAKGSVDLRYVPQSDHKRHGSQSFTAIIATNDPAKPELVLETKAWLCAAVDIDPPLLDCGVVPETGPVVKQVTVRCMKDAGGAILSISSIEPSSPVLKMEKKGGETFDWGELRRYDLVVDAAGIRGKFEGAVTIRSASPDAAPAKLVVKAEVQTCFKSTPPTILFGIVKRGRETEKTTVLAPRSKEILLQPTNVQCDDKRLTGVIESRADSNTWLLTVRLLAPEDTPALSKIDSILNVYDKGGVLLSSIPVHAIVASSDK